MSTIPLSPTLRNWLKAMHGKKPVKKHKHFFNSSPLDAYHNYPFTT